MNTKTLSFILIIIALGSLAVMLFMPKHVNLDTGKISIWKSTPESTEEEEEEPLKEE